MTAGEMKNEFLIHYNAIATNSAPSLDDFEISTYLTKAQLELIKDYYNPDGNKYKRGFEGSEKRRVDLQELVKNGVFTTITPNSAVGINENSQFVSLIDEIYLILQETVIVTSTDPCIDNSRIPVKVVSHDEYNYQIDNPFKKPSRDVAWRLNFSKVSGSKVVELISPYTITKYRVRYIKYPTPIIISNLNSTFPSEGLSIDGETALNDCELDKSIHREIVDRAVELALRDYKSSGLESKIQLDSRNE